MSTRARILIRFGAVAALAASGLAFAPAPPAAAGGTVLTVSTTDDVVDGGDGVLSLREAMEQVDALSGEVSIVLAQGAQYELDRCEGSDPGLRPELHGSLVVHGNGATIDQTCDERLLEAEGTDAAQLELRDLRVTSSADHPLALLWLDLDTTLDHVTVTGGTSEMAVHAGYGDLRMVDSALVDVEAPGETLIVTLRDLVLERTEIVGNVAGEAIGADGGLVADHLRIEGNELAGGAIWAAGEVELDEIAVRDNAGMSQPVLATSVDLDGGGPSVAEPVVIRDSGFVDNTSEAGPTEACCPLLDLRGADAQISGTSILANRGFDAAIATGPAFDGVERPAGDLVLANSAIAMNGGGGDVGTRAIDTATDVELQHVTIGGNGTRTGEAGSGAQVRADHLDTTSSYLLGQDSSSCAVASTTSHGGNVSTDQTCALAEADDRQDVAWEGDPGWGFEIPDLDVDLPVLQPFGADPGLDLRTDVGCGDDLPSDQLGEPRPQGLGCDTGAVETSAPTQVFSDVPPWHPFFADIEWAASQGIADGFEDGTYRPSLPVSRQAMAAFLYRMAGEPEIALPSPPTFSDVGPSHPFRAEVEWLAGSGIAGGFTDGTFRPSSPVSRQAMAAFLYRRAGEPASTPPSPPTFPDVGAGNPFRTEIEWLVAEGIADGYQDGTFKPANPVSRQAMAAFLHRLASD